MGMPNIPDINPEITLTNEQVINLLLASIALEEIGISHILNAEGEKLQTLNDMITMGQATMDDVTRIQDTVNKVMKTIISKEMLLQFKLEDIIDLIRLPRRIIHLNVATVTAMFEGITFSDSDIAYYYTLAQNNIQTAIKEYKEETGTSDITIQAVLGGVDLGDLTNYLFFFANGNEDANWQGATKGFIGDVAVDGIQASERTSGSVPYAGTIYTNDNTLGAWENIIAQNPTQAQASYNEIIRIADLENDLISAIQQINALPATPGFESVSSTSLNGLNTQNGINETFVINITSGLNFSSKINITGDAGDVFILRWDTDADPSNGYQGQVKPQSGGAIVPLGGLTPSNFINVAGDINSSGGGTTPLPPYPQGPRYDDGQGDLIIGGSDFSGGGFFTGYWLTTGAPTEFDPVSGLYIGDTSPLSNGIFVGGWYTLTTKFSMTSGTSGVYVSPQQVDEPAIDLEKFVSVDNGITWFDADTPPGPNALIGTNPQFRFRVTNIGNTTLTNIVVTDDVFGLIGTLPSLAPGASFEWIIVAPWQAGQHVNNATVTAQFDGQTLTDTDPAYYFGTEAAIDIEKEVSPDNGVTWFDADVPTGPFIPQGTNPQFRITVTNTGNVTLTNVNVTDNVFGLIGTLPSLAPGASFQWIIVGPWQAGQHVNVSTVTANFEGQELTDFDPAYYFGTTEPAIDIEKEVSPDNGVTWFDADVAPGPNILIGTDPQFRFTVTNTGGAPLSNVIVTDDVYGLIGTIPLLLPGDTFEWEITVPWEIGQHTNNATATGTFNGITVTDTDPANYFGTDVGIDIEKYVSPDNGVTWFDADTPPGPSISQGTNPQFRFVVTNIGNQTLTNITVTDDVFGLIGTLPSLAPGESFEWIIVGTWQLGQHVNNATVTGEFNGITVTDTDPAYYVGITEGAIQIIKYVSVDNGVTWLDANTPPGPLLPEGVNPQFRYVITNIGNVPLINIVVNDSVYGLIGTLPILNPGESFEWIIVG